MNSTSSPRSGQAGRALSSANGNGLHRGSTLSEEARDQIETRLFLWPTSAETTEATQGALDAGVILKCDPWSNSGNPKAIRDQQVVIVTTDTESGVQLAHERARECLSNKALSAYIWRLPGYGSKYSTLKAWLEKEDLAKALEFGWEDFVVFVSDSPKAIPDFSSIIPRPITVDLIPVPPLEDAMIPEPLREWILDIGNRAWAPVEYAAAAAIVALSGVIGCRLTVRPKRKDRWLIAPNLWGGVVGPPGVLKSPMVEEALRPLRRLAADAAEEHKQRMTDWAAEKLVHEAKQKVAAKRLTDAAGKSKKEADLLDLARQATAGNHTAHPSERRKSVNDVTIEKLQILMAENPHGLLYFRDELAGLLKSMDKQGHETDRKFFLECWGGLNCHRVERIGREDVNVSRACLAIFGTIQPGPLARYIGAVTGGEEDDGFMPRFQVLVYPDPPLKFIYVDRFPDTQAKARAYAVFKAIDALEPEHLLYKPGEDQGVQFDEDQGVHFIGFDDEAQDFFASWYTKLEIRLRSGTISHAMCCHLAKYRSLMPSLALIFHLINMVQIKEKIVNDKIVLEASIPALPPISIKAAMMASDWCDLLEGHARRMYQAAADGDPSDAVRLGDRIVESLSNPFTLRDVQRKGWTGLSSNEEVRRAVGILEDRGWVKMVEIPSSDPRGRGRPSEQVWINPRVMNGSAD